LQGSPDLVQLVRRLAPLVEQIDRALADPLAEPFPLRLRQGTVMLEGPLRQDMDCGLQRRALAHDLLPIVKATNCLIITPRSALKPALPELPCIRCRECAEACPVYLLRQQLLAFARDNNRTALHQLGLADCIECGCCDYVCPSNITLAARFHAAKQWADG
jgi:Na+-translocating ferredoxin:NAD+ oxidoreductase RnfC subunit